MKNLITLISIFAIAGSLMAQDAGPRGQRGKRQEPPAQGERGQRRNPLDMDAKILEDLKLNPEQKKKVGNLKKETADKAREMRDTQEDREKMREQMKALIEKYQTDLKKILTKEQGEKYDKAIKELRKKK
jgi:acyl-CoA reductase-like NAD-dependent aldehyde dehydrogenase